MICLFGESCMCEKKFRCIILFILVHNIPIFFFTSSFKFYVSKDYVIQTTPKPNWIRYMRYSTKPRSSFVCSYIAEFNAHCIWHMRIATSETILSHYCPECEILRLYMACTRKRFRIYNILYNSTCLYRVLNPQMPCKKSNRRNFAGFSQVLPAIIGLPVNCFTL